MAVQEHRRALLSVQGRLSVRTMATRSTKKDSDPGGRKKKLKETAQEDVLQQPEKKAKKTALTSIERSPTPRNNDVTDAFKILSLNVAGLRSTIDPAKGKADNFASVVQEEDPDILFLNEHKLKLDDVDAATERLKELLPAYEYVHFCCSTAKNGYSGVAALSKTELDVVETTFPGNEFAEEGRFLRVDVGNLQKVAVIAVYVPNSGQTLNRLEDRVKNNGWDRSMEKYIKNLDVPALIIGDLNVAHRPEDIHNMYVRPNFETMRTTKLSRLATDFEDQYLGLTALKKQAGLTTKERASFTELLEEAKLIDTFVNFHPEATGCFTYFSQRAVQNRPSNKGLRLDYVLASNDLLLNNNSDSPALLDSFILDSDPPISDHVPIGCLLRLP